MYCEHILAGKETAWPVSLVLRQQHLTNLYISELHTIASMSQTQLRARTEELMQKEAQFKVQLYL